MSHRVHRGWGRFPSSRMITFSSTCRYRNKLHQAALWASLEREVHLVCPRLFPHGQVTPTPLRLCRSPMLSHRVSSHRYRRYFFTALPSLEPSLLSLPVGGVLPHYPSLVCRLRLIPRRLAGASDRDGCLPDVFQQAHSTKQADQGIKCTLETAGVRQ